jgi:DNA-binding CsgD family transcriptional regulator
MTLLMSGRREEAVPVLRRVLRDADGAVWRGRGILVCNVGLELWDLDSIRSILTEQVAQLRATGALTYLPHALAPLAGALVLSGDFGTAEVLLAEGDELAEAIGLSPLRYPGLILAALRGDAARTTALVEESLRDATQRGEGLAVAHAHFATAVLLNGRADAAGALAAAERAVSPLEFSFNGLCLRELVEAAARAGLPERGFAGLAALREGTQASGTPWALGIEATCIGLLADGAAAEECFCDALAHLERAGLPLELGRTELLYGEWLRRRARRADARTQLRNAFARLGAIGADGFADRARRELLATGERARPRTPDAVDDLTPQERHIARLVATGATSKEVAAELFLSPRTIDAHLRSVFRKLGISSRRQLRGHPVIAAGEPDAVAPV